MNRSMPLYVRLVIVLAAAAIIFFTRSRGRQAQQATAPESPVTQSSPAKAQKTEPGSTGQVTPGSHSSKGFQSEAKLEEHFQKHGAEFQGATMESYLKMAQDERDLPAKPPIEELKREDGVVTRFDTSTGAFLAFDEDGTIRTFFKPNDGEAYFRRQAKR